MTMNEYDDDFLRGVLCDTKVIAVVGAAFPRGFSGVTGTGRNVEHRRTGASSRNVEQAWSGLLGEIPAAFVIRLAELLARPTRVLEITKALLHFCHPNDLTLHLRPRSFTGITKGG